MAIDDLLRTTLLHYQKSFSEKDYGEVEADSDLLMDVFGIDQELKEENKQYWGRELGMCWQLLLSALFSETNDDYGSAQKFGDNEPADFFLGKDAIDTKYRVGSGDSGTLKKFKQYGKLLSSKGYNPVFLFLRTDNLPAAITACKTGGWTILTGDETFNYIAEKSGFDLKSWLEKLKAEGSFIINRGR